MIPRRRTTATAFLVLVAVVLFVAARSHLPWTGEPSPDATRAPGPGVVGVIVEPDDGRRPILEEIEAAQRSILLEVYLLSDDETIVALEKAVKRGIEVRVILEEHPFGGGGSQPEVFDRLRSAGIDARWSNPTYTFSHIKTFVIDDTTAIIMNQNLTWSAFNSNREFAVVTTRPADVAGAQAIFEADWVRADTPEAPTLVVSPTDSRKLLLDLIASAVSTLDVYAEVISDRGMIEALGTAAERGVRVRLIMSSDSGEGDLERAALMRAGVEVRLFDRLYVHAKALIADGSRAFIGSQNLTSTSLEKNRELGIIVEDSANVGRVSSVFQRDFADGRPVNEELARAGVAD